MEEAAFVLGKVVRGIAGLAYAFGDVLVAFVGPDGSSKAGERKRRRKQGR
ncbi:hypothetical protein [Streptomyces sp. NPDC002133]